MFKKAAQKNLQDVGNVEEKSPKRKSKRKDKNKPTDILKPVPAPTEEEADTRKKMPKGLPSHWGPKVSSYFDVLKFSTRLGADYYCCLIGAIFLWLGSYQIKLYSCWHVI